MARIDGEELIAAAREATGLADFGGETFREGLARLLDALEREADLNAAGEATARHGITGSLANRLRVQDWLARHPEIEREEIEGPWLIVGLPRTGTTALSFLLSQDPEIRYLRTWESGAPCPPPEKASEHSDPRIAATAAGMEAAGSIYPELRLMHEATPTGPSECEGLLSMEMKSQHFDGSFRVPGYARWWADCDMIPAFQWHRRTLKLLQWRCPPNRWRLKAPYHVFHLGEWLQIYPNTRFIMTHRDPAMVLPSVCSLISVFQRAWCNSPDPVGLGRWLAEYWAEGLRRAIAWRDEHGDAGWVDVTHREIARDPLGTVERIYQAFAEKLSPAAAARVQAWVDENPKDKHGRHLYRAQDFGLSPDGLRDQYRFYLDRFDIPIERGS
jgi:hypothetical protein